MTPLVLLPGMMCDARLFAPLVAGIADRSVVVAPLDGHATVEDLVADVLAHAPPRFVIGGLSMGGIVAMEVLRQAPARIAGLILMDTNPLAETEDARAVRTRRLAAVRAGHLVDVMRDEIIPAYTHRAHPNPAIEALCMAMALDLGAEVYERQSNALRDRPDQTDTLRNYKGDAMILHGEDDQVCPPARHQLMHELMPHAQYVVVPKAGHLPPLEQPEFATKSILNF